MQEPPGKYEAARPPIEPASIFPECVRWESGFFVPNMTPSMRCVDITPEMAWLPAALRFWPVGAELLRSAPDSGMGTKLPDGADLLVIGGLTHFLEVAVRMIGAVTPSPWPGPPSAPPTWLRTRLLLVSQPGPRGVPGSLVGEFEHDVDAPPRKSAGTSRDMTLDPRHRTWAGSDRFVPRTFVQPFVRFTRIEAASGILLLAATALAVVWADSPWSDAYYQLFEGTRIVFEVGPIHLDESLAEVINDGLMAIFFFVVGLEIKRELVVGELRDPRTAALPAGRGGRRHGRARPLIYVAFNRRRRRRSTGGASRWPPTSPSRSASLAAARAARAAGAQGVPAERSPSSTTSGPSW